MVLAGWGIILAGFANIQLKAVYLNKVTPVETEDKLYLTGRVAATDVNYRGNQRLILEEMRNYDGETVPGRYKLTTLSKRSKPGLATVLNWWQPFVLICIR